MRIRKAMGLFFVCILIFCFAFIGCGKTVYNDEPKEKDGVMDSKKEESNKQVETSENSQTPERKLEGNMYTTGLPIVKDKVTLRFVVHKHPLNGDIQNMQIVKDLEEMTNIHIEIEGVAPSGWEEKKNLLLASGDLPDAFSGGGISGSDEVRYGPQGLFIPLEGLIDKYAPNVKELFAKRPEYKKAMITPDGHIYSLPLVHELLYRENPDNFFINKTWLNKLELKIPTTTQEYYHVLKTFRESDPNGNGKKDELPLSFVFNNSSNGIMSLFGSFGVLDNSDHLVIQGDKVIFSPIQPEYKEAIKYFNKLYKEGLIDPESFTQDLKQFRAKGKAKDMLFGSFLSWLDENEVGQDRAKNDYECIPPLKGPNGHQIWNRASNAFLGKGHFLITSANKYPEVTIRWADALYEPELSLQISRGPYDTNLKKNPDGSIEFIPTPEGMSYGEFRFQNTPGDAFPWAVLSDIYEKLELPEGQARKLKEHYPIYKPFLAKKVFPVVYYTLEQEERLVTLKTDIYNYVDQMKAKWIVGESCIDDQWDGYKNQLKKMGLEEMMKIYQDAYDSFNRNK